MGAPAPLQEAGAAALSLPRSYYENLAKGYRVRRDHLMPALTAAGFQCFRPRGAYYVMTDISAFGFQDDVSFAKYLVQEIGVARGAGIQFLSRSARWSRAGALRILQEARDAGRGRTPAY